DDCGRTSSATTTGSYNGADPHSESCSCSFSLPAKVRNAAFLSDHSTAKHRGAGDTAPDNGVAVSLRAHRHLSVSLDDAHRGRGVCRPLEDSVSRESALSMRYNDSVLIATQDRLV